MSGRRHDEPREVSLSIADFEKALSLMEQKRFDEALPLLLDLRTLDPNNARVNFALGLIASDQGDDALAARYFELAAAVATGKAIVFEAFAGTLLALGRLDEALEAGRKAAKLEPKNPQAHARIGEIYTRMHRPVLAEQAFRRALQLDPDNPAALVGLAELQRSTGDFAGSAENYRKAVATGKNFAPAYLGLTKATKFETAPDELNEIEALIAEPEPKSHKELSALHRAAGKIYHDIGDLERAFQHYDAARLALYPPYNLEQRRALIAALRETLTPTFFAQRSDIAFETDRPVFVVGMPRSGTTLVEQIIGRHPQAVGAGELTYFNDVCRSLGFYSDDVAGLIRRITSLDERDLRRIGRRYLGLLESIDHKAKRIVDKMPHNFEALWLIALLFPKAALIHCRRNPLDVCVSILTNPMTMAHAYSRDQATLGAYYRLYEELMTHWHAVLPVLIRDQSYEAVVADQEGESRALIEHVGLAWDDACLEFYKGSRPVTTLSDEQVRRPIYKSAVERWRRYERLLAPELLTLAEPATANGHA